MAVSPEDRAVVERFKRVLVERGVPVSQAILFGSRARGDHEPDSDYDVLVVVERVDREMRDLISHCAWETGFDDCLVITPVVVSREDVEHRPFRSSLLMHAVRQDGVAI